VLAKVCHDVDLGAEAFPYMGVRLGSVAGIPARLLRVGFVGELGYEIHVPASQGEALWDALMAAGGTAGIKPFGVEAQRVLRLEKGHIIIGQDTDGLTHPLEADMAWAIARSKPYFMGGRSMPTRAPPASWWLHLEDPAAPVRECYLTLRNETIVGRVAAVRSPALDGSSGSPMSAGSGNAGTQPTSEAGGRLLQAKVVKPFFDPDSGGRCSHGCCDPMVSPPQLRPSQLRDLGVRSGHQRRRRERIRRPCCRSSERAESGLADLSPLPRTASGYRHGWRPRASPSGRRATAAIASPPARWRSGWPRRRSS
jgi:hypothetical protein